MANSQNPKRSLFRAAKNTVVEGLFTLEDVAHFGGVISRSLLSAGAATAMNFADESIDECAMEMAQRQADRSTNTERQKAYDNFVEMLAQRRSN